VFVFTRGAEARVSMREAGAVAASVMAPTKLA
jgi:hypothetical protein